MYSNQVKILNNKKGSVYLYISSKYVSVLRTCSDL